MFVNTGLIEAAETEAELAGAMAHEIAHVTARHITRQASRGPYLTRMPETGRYPTVARLVIDGAHPHAEETFNHNLTTILDGITSHPHT